MNTKDILKFFKRYFKSEKKIFVKAFIFILITSLLGLVFGYLMGLSIDKASTGAFAIAILLLVLNLVLSVIDNLFFDRISKILVNRMCINMIEKIGYEVYYKVGLLPARAFEEKTSGELINRITSDSSNIADTFKQVLWIGVSLFSSVLVFIYICFHSWIVALEVIIYLALFCFFSKKFLPEIKAQQKEITKEKDNVVAEVNESIRGIREIRALGIREKINYTIKNIIRNIYYRSYKQMLSERNYHAAIASLNAMFETTVFITCVVLICFKATSFAFFMSLTYYIYRFMNTIDGIMTISTSYQKMKVSIERIDEILSNKLYKDEFFGTVDKTDIEGNIEFKNVTFKYSEKEQPIFNGLNLKLDTKKKIAIVGKSGQGKTSLFNLLLRYFEANEGVVLIDDIPIEDYSEVAFHKNIAIIRQDPFLFNKTILENFKVLDEKLSLKKIREACKTAEIDEYIMSLPDKYNTKLGEGGVNLSGGQKQRIAIARALLKDSRIILFDEATSALDNESQGKIKKAIDNLVKDHTIIIIAHRLSTIKDADEIYVIDQGHVAAQGTHETLIKKNKIYKSLYNEES